MTASEFALLALGLVFGVAGGALLVELGRVRPPAPRTVRVTVVAEAVPRRRPATLAEDAFAMFAEPAVGGPGERDDVDEYAANSWPPVRTLVRSGPQPPAGAGDPASSRPARRRPIARRIAVAAARERAAATTTRPFTLTASLIASEWGTIVPNRIAAVGIPIHAETDWTLAALRAVAAVTADRAIRGQGHAGAVTLDWLPSEAGATTARSNGSGHDSGPTRTVAEADRATAEGGRDADPPGEPRADDPCSGVRTMADERCAVAARARERADATYGGLLGGHRAYDEHITTGQHTSVAGDQRSIRSAKETAQRVFRDARAAALTKDGVEAAARDWLSEINRINNAARDSAVGLERERQTAEALVATIERLTVEAEAARISADAAETACAGARRALADCERTDTARVGHEEAPGTQTTFVPAEPVADDDAELEAAFTAGDVQERAIVRLLRGDHETLGRLVEQLAAAEPHERRRWQLALAQLVDAIVARSIEASVLIFPDDHPFWGGFTRSQQRDIAGALSSLGYHFDGLGGWADERVPSQRDLSLAVGYAGLDPMRIRRWPTEEEMAELYRDVAAAADEYLAGAARGLTLGELITALGRRADALTEVWNEWPRLRPLLLASG